jgi:hypothetical protein
LSVSNYISFIYSSYQSDILSSRKEELFTVLDSLSQSVLNISYHEQSDILDFSITSTSDHHGVLGSPFSLSQNYERANYLSKLKYKTLTTLSCANISISNNSFPRGFSLTDIDQKVHHLPLISLKNKNIPVYVTPKIIKSNIIKVIDSIYLLKLDKKDKLKIILFLKKLLNESFLYSLKDFDEQISYINFLFFKELEGLESIDLFYFSQESIVRDLILNYHLNSKTVINSLLFDDNFHLLYKKYFKNLVGSFDEDKKTGTHLFWGFKNKKRISLFLKDRNLIESDGTVFLKLDKVSLEKGLRGKILIPSTSLVFIVVSFYYGIQTGGGYLQVDYLPKLKNAWISILKDFNLINELSIVDKTNTDLYLGDFAFLKNKFGSLSNGFDVILEENKLGLDISLLDSFKQLKFSLFKN